MKKIMTAINNPKLNEELKKEKNFEIVGKDIQYKEAILEILEKDNNIDLIIISEKISGEMKLEKLIQKIKQINEKIKLIFILEKENINLEKMLIKNNILDIYYNNKINLNELIKIINKKEINMEEEIIKLRKIIEEKNKNNKIKKRKNNLKRKYLKQIKNKIEMIIINKTKKEMKSNYFSNVSTKIITFSGNYKSGKSTLALVISQYLAEENYKVLLIDGDLENQNLSIILKNKKCKKSRKRKSKINKNKLNKKIKLINKKNSVYNYKIKKEINLSKIKINKNLYLFNKLNNLLNNKIIRKKYSKNNFLKLINKNYNFIIIDLSKNNSNKINKEIIENSDINFVLLEPNFPGIKECKKMLKKYLIKWKVKSKNLYIILNKKNINSINKNLISKSLFSKNKICEINENKIYQYLINNYFKIKILLKNKKIKKEIKKIICIIKSKKII